jgi:hypothetical protein
MRQTLTRLEKEGRTFNDTAGYTGRFGLRKFWLGSMSSAMCRAEVSSPMRGVAHNIEPLLPLDSEACMSEGENLVH